MSRRSLLSLVIVTSFISAAKGEAAKSNVLCHEIPGTGLELSAGERGVVVENAAAAAAAAGVRTGDQILQINGLAVGSCGDAEQAVSSAHARSVTLLLLVKRVDESIAVVLPPVSDELGRRSSQPRSHAASEMRLPALPVADGPSEPLVAAAAKAVEALSELEKAAVLLKPLALYQRRLAETEGIAKSLKLGKTASGRQLARAVGDLLAYHRTASEMWQLKLSKGEHLQYDRRSLGRPLPYFTNSKVERWISRYPFLQATVVQEPREVSLVMPGEGAGLWNVDQALELIWAKARAGRLKIETWITTGGLPGDRGALLQRRLRGNLNQYKIFSLYRPIHSRASENHSSAAPFRRRHSLP